MSDELASPTPWRRALTWMRPVLAFILACVAATWSAAAPAASAAAHERPTIVLVHGAFSAPSAWERVVAGLHKDGYATVTPALGLHGVSSDVTIVRSTLDAIAGPDPRRTLLRWLRGLERLGRPLRRRGHRLHGRLRPRRRRNHQRPGHRVRASSFPRTTIPSRTPAVRPVRSRRDRPRPLPRRLRSGPQPELAGALAAAQTPTDLGILFTPSGPVGCTPSPAGTPCQGPTGSSTRTRSGHGRRAGSVVVTFDDASHAGGFTHYAARLVKLIEEAAQAAG